MYERKYRIFIGSLLNLLLSYRRRGSGPIAQYSFTCIHNWFILNNSLIVMTHNTNSYKHMVPAPLYPYPQNTTSWNRRARIDDDQICGRLREGQPPIIRYNTERGCYIPPATPHTRASGSPYHFDMIHPTHRSTPPLSNYEPPVGCRYTLT